MKDEIKSAYLQIFEYILYIKNNDNLQNKCINTFLMNNCLYNVKDLFLSKNMIDFNDIVEKNYRYYISDDIYKINDLQYKNFLFIDYMIKAKLYYIYLKFTTKITNIRYFVERDDLIYPNTNIKLYFKNVIYDLKYNKIIMKNNNNVDGMYDFIFSDDVLNDKYSYNKLKEYLSFILDYNINNFMKLIMFGLIKKPYLNKYFILYNNNKNYKFIYHIILKIFDKKYYFIKNKNSLSKFNKINLNKNLCILGDKHIDNFTYKEIEILENIKKQNVNIIILNNKIINNIILSKSLIINFLDVKQEINYTEKEIETFSNILIHKCLQHYKSDTKLNFN